MHRVATIGVAEHVNSAVLVTLSSGELLDRRTIDLTDRGLPTHPHHHEGSWAVGRYLKTPGARVISLADAVAIVERVRASAVRGAREGLEALAAVVPMPITAIAIRECQQFRRRPRSGSRTIARKPLPIPLCIARPSRPPPRRAAGPCIGMTARVCFARRQPCSAAKTSPISCPRWADRSDRPGRPGTNWQRLPLLGFLLQLTEGSPAVSRRR